MAQTIKGTFATRQAVELAVEHLVQEYGIERTDIFIEPVSAENSVGTNASGGDADSPEQKKSDGDAALNGPLIVSVDMNEDEAEAVRAAFRDAGATDISDDGKLRSALWQTIRNE